MPTRSQFLVLTGLLAIGMTLGSLATYFLSPAAQVVVKVPIKEEKPKQQIAAPIDPPVEKKPAKDVAPAVVVAVPPATKPALDVSAPGAIVAQKAAPAPDKPNPEDILRTKGLKRSNLVYVLEAEEILRDGYNDLLTIFNQWEITVTRMNQANKAITECEFFLAYVTSPATRANNSGAPASELGGDLAQKVQGPAFKELLTELTGVTYDDSPQGNARPETEKANPRRKEAGNSKGKKNSDPSADDGRYFNAGSDPYQGQMANQEAPNGQVNRQVPFGNEQFPVQNNPMGVFGEPAEPRPMHVPIERPQNPEPREKERDKEREKSEPARENHESKKLYVKLPGVFQVRAMPNETTLLVTRINAFRNAYYSLEIQALNQGQEFDRRRFALRRLELDLYDQYAKLKNDEDVLEALGELNKTSNMKFALGPEVDYRQNLAKMTKQMLKKEGVIKDLGGNYQFTTVKVAANNSRKAEIELRKALESRRKAKSDLDTTRSGLGLATKNKEAKALANHQKNLPKHQAELDAINKDVVVKREIYVQRVAALRGVVDDCRKQAVGLKKDQKIAIDINPAILAYLTTLETTISSKEVVLKPDKTIFWVRSVHINDKSSDMVFEPSADLIRMSAASAAKLGIKLDNAGPPEEITLGDDTKLTAKRVTLKSVQVGKYTVKDVDCLVIPEGFDSPPVLGASFLNHFTFHFSPDSEKITLTQVDLKDPKSR